MASASLVAFIQAIGEVRDLGRADPTPVGGASLDANVSRVVGRASVVLLSSHFERYIYSINEEATTLLNSQLSAAAQLPELFRLLHTKNLVDQLVETSWERRGDRLREFVRAEAWLWAEGSPIGDLDHNRLLTWMSAPKPKNLVRYYRYWGVDDIFSAITRAAHTRSDLWLKLDELVQKRNNIAHGDRTTEATPSDLRGYEAATQRFCERADRRLARTVGAVVGSAAVW